MDRRPTPSIDLNFYKSDWDLLSTKEKQVDSKRENMDESNMLMEKIIKEMF